MVCRINYRAQFGPIVGYALKQSKNPVIVASSMCGVTVQSIIKEFESVSVLNPRCKTPCAHFILSPAPGDKLNIRQWEELCRKTATEFGATQWVGVLHKDTQCEHVSLVMSRIDVKGKAWKTSNDRYRLREICTNFEIENGLTRTATHSNEPRIVKEELERANRLYDAGKASNPVPDRLQIAVAVKAAMMQSYTLEAFERTLLRQKIVTRWRYDDEGKPVGVSWARGEAAISGRNAGITCQALTVYYGEKGTNTHAQRSEFEVPGGSPVVDRASGSVNSAENPSGFGGEHSGTCGNTGAAEGFDRVTANISGVDEVALREVSALVARSTSGLEAMIQEEVRDGERFIQRQRPVFRPRHRIYKTKGVSL